MARRVGDAAAFSQGQEKAVSASGNPVRGERLSVRISTPHLLPATRPEVTANPSPSSLPFAEELEARQARERTTHSRESRGHRASATSRSAIIGSETRLRASLLRQMRKKTSGEDKSHAN